MEISFGSSLFQDQFWNVVGCDMAKNKLLAVILSACVLSTLAQPVALPCGEGLTYDCYNGPNNVEEMNMAMDDAVSYFQSVLQALGCSQFMNGAIVSFQKVIQPLMGFLNMALRRGCNSEYCGFGIPSVIGGGVGTGGYNGLISDGVSPALATELGTGVLDTLESGNGDFGGDAAYPAGGTGGLAGLEGVSPALGAGGVSTAAADTAVSTSVSSSGAAGSAAAAAATSAATAVTTSGVTAGPTVIVNNYPNAGYDPGYDGYPDAVNGDIGVSKILKVNGGGSAYSAGKGAAVGQESLGVGRVDEAGRGYAAGKAEESLGVGRDIDAGRGGFAAGKAEESLGVGRVDEAGRGYAAGKGQESFGAGRGAEAGRRVSAGKYPR